MGAARRWSEARQRETGAGGPDERWKNEFETGEEDPSYLLDQVPRGSNPPAPADPDARQDRMRRRGSATVRSETRTVSALRRSAQAVLIAVTTATPSIATAQAPARPMEIVVNIPAGRLDVLQGGERIRSYPVSVGRSRYATPTGQASIRRMVWNPTWTPPPDAEWARDEKPTGPGWSNPMGRVKMHLFGDYYVHGTPAGNERHLGRPASHGCVRMRNRDVMELAELVLKADGAPVEESTLRRLAANPRATRELALAGRVRVRIEYRLAEVAADSVTLHPDVYGRAAGSAYAARIRTELAAAGADPVSVLASVDARRAPAAAVTVYRERPLLGRADVLALETSVMLDSDSALLPR
jgi:lipoprotein-anchoring transpeptidase ErfK/SrfK